MERGFSRSILLTIIRIITIVIKEDASEESIWMEDDSEEIESPTKMELIEAIEAIKNNKSLGIDNLSGELIKAREVETQQQMEIIYSDMEQEAHTEGVEDRHHLSKKRGQNTKL